MADIQCDKCGRELRYMKSSGSHARLCSMVDVNDFLEIIEQPAMTYSILARAFNVPPSMQVGLNQHVLNLLTHLLDLTQDEAKEFMHKKHLEWRSSEMIMRNTKGNVTKRCTRCTILLGDTERALCGVCRGVVPKTFRMIEDGV